VTLAREALAIDAESAALRGVASNLQRLADTWASASADARRQTVDAIGAAVAAETARALAVPPAAPATAAAPLAGAFDAALRRGGSR